LDNVEAKEKLVLSEYKRKNAQIMLPDIKLSFSVFKAYKKIFLSRVQNVELIELLCIIFLSSFNNWNRYN